MDVDIDHTSGRDDAGAYTKRNTGPNNHAHSKQANHLESLNLSTQSAVDVLALAANNPNKSIDMDRLKQLHRLMQMQQLASNRRPSQNGGNGFASLDSPNGYASVPSSGLMDSTSDCEETSSKQSSNQVRSSNCCLLCSCFVLQDNLNYLKDLFQSDGSTVGPSNSYHSESKHSSVRRPLSSWKQSLTACGPGPAPWVDKTTLISLGIQSKSHRCGNVSFHANNRKNVQFFSN